MTIDNQPHTDHKQHTFVSDTQPPPSRRKRHSSVTQWRKSHLLSYTPLSAAVYVTFSVIFALHTFGGG